MSAIGRDLRRRQMIRDCLLLGTHGEFSGLSLRVGIGNLDARCRVDLLAFQLGIGENLSIARSLSLWWGWRGEQALWILDLQRSQYAFIDGFGIVKLWIGRLKLFQRH